MALFLSRRPFHRLAALIVAGAMFLNPLVSVAGQLMGKDPTAGALGGLSEGILSNLIPGDFEQRMNTNLPFGNALYTGATALAAGVIAEATGHDGVTAARAAQNAAVNNTLSDKRVEDYTDCVAKRGVPACSGMRQELDALSRVSNEQLAKSCSGADISCQQQLRYARDFLDNSRFDDPQTRALFADDLAATQKVFDLYGGQYRAPTPPPGVMDILGTLFGGGDMPKSGNTLDYATGFGKSALNMVLTQAGGVYGDLLYTMPPGVFGYDQYAADSPFEVPLTSREELRGSQVLAATLLVGSLVGPKLWGGRAAVPEANSVPPSVLSGETGLIGSLTTTGFPAYATTPWRVGETGTLLSELAGYGGGTVPYVAVGAAVDYAWLAGQSLAGLGGSQAVITLGSGLRLGEAANALDWSRISSRTGGNAAEHVTINHSALSLTKPDQGVFYGNPVSSIEDAWSIAQQIDLKPVTAGGVDIYVVPRPNSGYAGGMGGQLGNYDYVTIITDAGTNRVITAYTSGGTPPLPKVNYDFLLGNP